MNTLTQDETVEVTLYIHACAPWSHNKEQMEKGYRIHVGDTDLSSLGKYIKIGEVDVPVNVPAGVDVLSGMIEGLRGEQNKLRAEAEGKCNEIEAQIQSMMAITHQPEGEAE